MKMKKKWCTFNAKCVHREIDWSCKPPRTEVDIRIENATAKLAPDAYADGVNVWYETWTCRGGEARYLTAPKSPAEQLRIESRFCDWKTEVLSLAVGLTAGAVFGSDYYYVDDAKET